MLDANLTSRSPWTEVSLCSDFSLPLKWFCDESFKMQCNNLCLCLDSLLFENIRWLVTCRASWRGTMPHGTTDLIFANSCFDSIASTITEKDLGTIVIHTLIWKCSELELSQNPKSVFAAWPGVERDQAELFCPQYDRERHILACALRRDATSLPFLSSNPKGTEHFLWYVNSTGRFKPTFGDVSPPPQRE
jgi:hypothetical protein